MIAQSIKSYSITSSGASMSQNGGKISFSVGEIVVKTMTDGTNSIGQGIINTTTTNIVTAIKETDISKIRVNIYPNPANDLVFIDINDSKIPIIQLTVFDINGRQIISEQFSAINNHIGLNTNSWQKGNYFVTLSDLSGKLLGSYKIAKQ